jgi:hypothetical protein
MANESAGSRIANGDRFDMIARMKISLVFLGLPQLVRRPRFLSGILAVALFGCAVDGLPTRAADGAKDAVASGSVVLSTENYSFRLSTTNGSYALQDRRAGVIWRSNPFRGRFGEVTLRVNPVVRTVPLSACAVTHTPTKLSAVFHPLPEQPAWTLTLTVTALPDRQTLEFAYAASDPSLIESVRLLDEAFWVTESESGYVIVPVREGMLIPADSGLAFTQTFGTYDYEGCHMAMAGMVKNRAALLVTWDDPYFTFETRSALTNAPGVNARQILSSSLVLRKSARAFRIRVEGKGDYGTLAKSYRQIASEKGWRVTWQDKLTIHPDDAKLWGAINFKLWSVLSRQMNDESSQEQSKRLNWTFDEAAQVAEHLKRDLQLERVLFTLGGWIHRGYDNQHPDILPAAPECGGDEALADCSRRVRALGYLFCLHDNYQDIYRDSPSWDEKWVMKRPDGSLSVGGKWGGGRAYLTCSSQALELARRPQNLAAVQRLTGANSYFIDTTYAAGLQECFDPHHPLTRQDDLHWKQALSDYARGLFGVFGSECGREWAIPHSDFFEGLTGVGGRGYHNEQLASRMGASIVPLFEMVYRDCIAMYGKYGYDINRASDYVLHHISLGRPLNYHSVPAHCYWTQPAREAVSPVPSSGHDPAVFTRAHQGWAEGMHPLDRFVKNTYEILSPLHELTANLPLTQHDFLTADRQVIRTVFGDGTNAVTVVVNRGTTHYLWRGKVVGTVRLPPDGFVVQSERFAAFSALNWRGIDYARPVLFTLRSLDGHPIDRSKRVRIYHGFGEARLKLGSRVLTVPKETVASAVEANKSGSVNK